MIRAIVTDIEGTTSSLSFIPILPRERMASGLPTEVPPNFAIFMVRRY